MYNIYTFQVTIKRWRCHLNGQSNILNWGILGNHSGIKLLVWIDARIGAVMSRWISLENASSKAVLLTTAVPGYGFGLDLINTLCADQFDSSTPPRATPPGIWTFEDWLVQIPSPPGRKAVQMPHQLVLMNCLSSKTNLVFNQALYMPFRERYAVMTPSTFF